MSRIVSFLVLIAVILIISVIFFRVMAGFVLPLFLAALLVVMFRPLHAWIFEKCNRRPRTAALLTTISVMLIVIAPLGALITMAAGEGRELVKRLDVNRIVQQAGRLTARLGLAIPNRNHLDRIADKIDKIQQLNNTSPKTIQDFKLVEMELDDLYVQSKALGDERKLSWPEVDADRGPESDSSSSIFELGQRSEQRDWEKFAAEIDRAKTLVGLDVDQVNDDTLRTQAILNLQISLSELKRSFRDYKVTLLGGPPWSSIKEVLNPNEEKLAEYKSVVTISVRNRILRLGPATTAYLARTIMAVLVMVVSLYFFLLDGPRMIDSIKSLSPLDDDHEQELVEEFDKVSRAVVLATLLSAIAQGILAGIGFYFSGVDSVFLLMLLTMFLALIPFVGAAAVWVPVCFWLYLFEDRLAAAIVLAVYGVLIISMADNVIKPFVLHGQSNLHPLLALLSVLGGVTTLGPIGILVGPMVVAFLQTLLKILQRELLAMDHLQNSDNANNPSQPAAES